jgi:predicted nucleotidyltransferase
MQLHGIDIPQQKIAAFCRKHRIRRLALFGSILRDDFTPESDIDVLVEFEPGCVPGLLTMAGLEIELSDILGRKADLRTPAELSRHFRDEVLSEARESYVAA